MTDEERVEKERQEAVAAALAEAEAKAKDAEKAIVAELQAERQRRKAAEEEIERAKGELNKNTQGSDPEEVLKKLLKERDETAAKENKQAALEEFRNSVKEFSKENDEAGIVFSAFERELKKFNLEGLKSKADFNKRFKDVYDFMSRSKPTPPANPSQYEGGQPGTGTEPKESDSANLSDVELKLCKDMGWDKERYLKQKAIRPTYVASLLRYRS